MHDIHTMHALVTQWRLLGAAMCLYLRLATSADCVCAISVLCAWSVHQLCSTDRVGAHAATTGDLELSPELRSASLRSGV